MSGVDRPVEIDESLIGLGIRQPWIELILNGAKTIEVRSRPTRIRGPILLYASKTLATGTDALAAASKTDADVSSLPRGLVVGQVDLVDCRVAAPGDAAAACVSEEGLSQAFSWILARPRRFTTPIKPRFLPYGVWFYPFRERAETT